MSLTGKQEKFAQCIAEGMTQSDAYRAAYNVGANTKNETIWRKAAEVMEVGRVSARVQELKAQLSAKALWTREMSVQALTKAYEMAESGANSAAMTGAIKELNVMHGYNAPSKMDVTNSDGSLKPAAIILRAADTRVDHDSE